MQVSAVIIAKNEEAVIARCLESVKGLHEIVVLDTGSIDRTKEIALEYGAKVFDDFTWCDDFSAARNHAASKATGDWLLAIDCDNYLLDPASTVFKECAKAEAAGAVTATIVAKYPAGNYHNVSGLFRPTAKWVGRVHECLSPAPAYKSKIKIGIGESKAKASDPDRNLRILMASDLTQPRNLFYLGKESFERHNWNGAIFWLDTYLKNKGRWWPEMAWAHLLLSYSWSNLNNGDKARDHALESLRQNPDCKETLLRLADLHMEPWKTKWLRLAAAAKNEDVLFVRT